MAKKFDTNVIRDQQVYAELKKQSIRCLTVWECSIKSALHSTENEERLLEKILTFIKSNALFQEI